MKQHLVELLDGSFVWTLDGPGIGSGVWVRCRYTQEIIGKVTATNCESDNIEDAVLTTAVFESPGYSVILDTGDCRRSYYSRVQPYLDYYAFVEHQKMFKWFKIVAFQQANIQDQFRNHILLYRKNKPL